MVGGSYHFLATFLPFINFCGTICLFMFLNVRINFDYLDERGKLQSAAKVGKMGRDRRVQDNLGK